MINKSNIKICKGIKKKMQTCQARDFMSKEKISVIIVDDHPLFRRGVKLYLESIPEIELVAEAGSGEGVLSLLESGSNADVILMDLQMSGMSGEKTTEVINMRWSEVRVLVLSSYGRWDKVHAVLKAGASGYLLKDAEPDELVVAIKAVHCGGTYFNKEIATTLLNHANQKREIEFADMIEPLTERELDVLKLIGQGLGNFEIAKRLYVSQNTVKTHVARIFQKLGVSSRTQAALYAFQKELI